MLDRDALINELREQNRKAARAMSDAGSNDEEHDVLAGSIESTRLAIQAIQTLQRMHDVFSDLVEEGRVTWRDQRERRKALRMFDRSNGLCYLTLSLSPPNRRKRPAQA